MLKLIRLISVLWLVLLSACTTTSSTFSKSYANSSVGDTGTSYDLQKAAATRLTMGLRYLSQGDYEKAKFNFDKALFQNPGSEEVQRGVAYYYEQVNELKSAEEHYKKALKINNRNPALLNQYGAFLCQHNRFKESQEMFMASVNIPTNKDVSGTYENAAKCMRKDGNIEVGEQFFRKALNHNPEQPGSLLGMANIEYAKGRYQRTRGYLSRYESIAKHNPQSLWLAIRNESKLKNMDAVASYANRLTQLFPDSRETELYLDTKNQWLK